MMTPTDEQVERLRCRGELCVMWLEHLLLLSMLQYPSGRWTWGRYLVVHPAANTDVSGACSTYRTMLTDQSTFATITLAEVFGSGVLPAASVVALRDRSAVVSDSP